MVLLTTASCDTAAQFSSRGLFLLHHSLLCQQPVYLLLSHLTHHHQIVLEVCAKTLEFGPGEIDKLDGVKQMPVPCYQVANNYRKARMVCQFACYQNLDLEHVSFSLSFSLYSNPTTLMIFIVVDSFVCTSFIQPVQRFQLKTGPASRASGAGELILLLCLYKVSTLTQSTLSPARV